MYLKDAQQIAAMKTPESPGTVPPISVTKYGKIWSCFEIL